MAHADSPTTTGVTGTARVPLCVDLDETLIRTDLLLESLLLLARQKPLLLLSLSLWLIRGRAYFKQRIAAAVQFDPELIPYDEEVLSWLHAERDAGRRIVLATASNRRLAEPVAAHVGLFDEVLASDETTNLKGRRKLAKLIERFGRRGFEYAADARADIPVWREARGAILVRPAPGVAAALEGTVPIVREFPRRSGRVKAIVKAMRVRQWVKNILVFLPLLAGQSWHQPALLLKALMVFFALSLCASSMYVLNDLLDLPADRQHRSKRRRPFASGALPISLGLVLLPGLLIAGLAIAAIASRGALGLVIVYVLVTTLYSFWLKRKMLIDVFTLSLLYTLRVLIGSAATGLLSSPWLLGFSVFTFLSLAAAKRGAELMYSEQSGREGPSGRDYFIWDRQAVSALGEGAAFGAALVLALYLQSEQVHVLYAQPSWLWLLVPLILYWLTRIWMLTLRGAMDDDPIVFATTDRLTWIVAALCVLVIAAGTLAPFPLPGAQP
ncbi:MAG: UbiA family prenyltransferase [Methylotetracoccus sp.]